MNAKRLAGSWQPRERNEGGVLGLGEDAGFACRSGVLEVAQNTCHCLLQDSTCRQAWPSGGHTRGPTSLL